jgi:hypothetical protein
LPTAAAWVPPRKIITSPQFAGIALDLGARKLRIEY